MICENLFWVLEIEASRIQNTVKSQLGLKGKKRRVKMLEGKALIEDTDMPVKMQIQAMAAASQALDIYDVFDCRSIAAHIKKVSLSLSLSLLSLSQCWYKEVYVFSSWNILFWFHS